ncbi:cytochrome P450 [Streptomyces sp. NPDC051098]|uniref:cytochrome P450 n=1 Tax=Streptomyces sp. NPDC051098 TaxID=3155411 RepID=UPI003432836D
MAKGATPASTVQSPGSSELDLFHALAQPDRLQDPYPFYAWLRANRPVHTDLDGTVYLSHYEDAIHLRDPDLRTASADDTRSFALHTFNQTLVKAVPPRHGELRRVAGAAFDRRLLAKAGERMKRTAEGLTEQLVATLAAEGRADLHAMYSLPFTQRAAAAVFGIPDEDFELLAAMPARLFAPLYPKSTPAAWAEADEASRALYTYMENTIRRRGFTPESGFARLAEAAGTAPDDEITRLCWILWLGSYTSAMAALDLAMLTLIEHPHTAPLLQQDADAWVAEALRYRSPHVINSANLTTRRELVIGTTTLPPNTPVRFLLASMNRDENAFPHADTFDPARTGQTRHIAFGEGIHSCIGAQLARMELATALTTLNRQLPNLSLIGQPTWRPYTTQRLCTHLPVAAT